MHEAPGARDRRRRAGKKLASDDRRQFAYLLSLSTGRLDVEAMLNEMTPRQFAGWWQYYRLKPWGGDWHRTSLQTARMLNTIRALTGAKNEQSDFIEDDAYIPKWRTAGNDADLSEVERQCEAADSIEGLGV